MTQAALDDLTVSEVLSQFPQTIPMFLQHDMACVGCAMTAFETVREAAAIYRLDPDRFVDELLQTIQLTRENR